MERQKIDFRTKCSENINLKAEKKKLENPGQDEYSSPRRLLPDQYISKRKQTNVANIRFPTRKQKKPIQTQSHP